MKNALIIFGSTGDLMYKKLIPAINQLIRKNHLSTSSKVYAVGRREYTVNQLFEEARVHIEDEIDWDTLKRMTEYVRMDIDTQAHFDALRNKVHEEGFEHISIYLAVPPKLFPSIAKGVSKAGLIEKGDSNARIVFEKPFGHDLKSAQAINQSLSNYFDETQIYRIDHYLGKEMIQNILVVRFANQLFQNAWSSKTIKKITILAKEKGGVKSRGAYYDGTGALKDMLQSHLLQMAALMTMDKPKTFKSKDIKNEKVRALKRLSFDSSDMVLGQYEGYRDTDEVDEHSKTETFAYVEASIKEGPLKGVPVSFVTGKALDEKQSGIIVYFKDDESIETLFPNAKKNTNKLTIKVAPEEGVSFQLSVKEPGHSTTLVPVELDYCHSCNALENIPEAYEKLLLDLLKSDRTLFTRWDEVETTWSLTETIKKDRHNLVFYKTYQDLLNKIKEKGVNTDDL
jgi:glucose-6-phosphate 1-dehydrogenase